MGSNTRNFRQTPRSISASTQTANYSQINRSGIWNKIINKIKLRKGEIK